MLRSLLLVLFVCIRADVLTAQLTRDPVFAAQVGLIPSAVQLGVLKGFNAPLAGRSPELGMGSSTSMWLMLIEPRARTHFRLEYARSARPYLGDDGNRELELISTSYSFGVVRTLHPRWPNGMPYIGAEIGPSWISHQQGGDPTASPRPALVIGNGRHLTTQALLGVFWRGPRIPLVGIVMPLVVELRAQHTGGAWNTPLSIGVHF